MSYLELGPKRTVIYVDSGKKFAEVSTELLKIHGARHLNLKNWFDWHDYTLSEGRTARVVFMCGPNKAIEGPRADTIIDLRLIKYPVNPQEFIDMASLKISKKF